MNKPSIFKLLDFVSFGLLSIITLVIAGLVDFGSSASLQAKLLMSVVSLVFTAIYGVVLYMRKKEVDALDFMLDSLNLGVILNGATYTKEQIEYELNKTINLWKTKVTWNSNTDKQLQKFRIIQFQPGELQIDGFTGYKHVAGMISSADNLVVGFSDRPIEKTALAHELNHILYYGYTGILDNEKTHKFLSDNGLS